MGSKRKSRFTLILLILLIFWGLLFYDSYLPTKAQEILDTNHLYERGKSFFSQVLSPSQRLEEWSYPLPSLNQVLYVEGGKERFPSYWRLALPLNLSPNDLEGIVTSLEALFPKGIFSVERGLQGTDPFLEVNLFFLKSHHILFQRPTPKARMAIVIDDFGEFSASIGSFASISAPITMSVLPKLQNSRSHALQILEMGQELLLHQPMEPLNENLHPGPGAIYAHMEREEIKKILEENIASLPSGVVGVNNHMGSRVTLDREVMEKVLGDLQERGLFFLDSSTVVGSTAPALKERIGMPLLVNRLFIDNMDDYKYICDMLVLAGEMALKEGDLITIGHARAQTARAIESTLPFFERQGILLVHLSSLI